MCHTSRNSHETLQAEGSRSGCLVTACQSMRHRAYSVQTARLHQVQRRTWKTGRVTPNTLGVDNLNVASIYEMGRLDAMIKWTEGIALLQLEHDTLCSATDCQLLSARTYQCSTFLSLACVCENALTKVEALQGGRFFGIFLCWWQCRGWFTLCQCLTNLPSSNQQYISHPCAVWRVCPVLYQPVDTYKCW